MRAQWSVMEIPKDHSMSLGFQSEVQVGREIPNDNLGD